MLQVYSRCKVHFCSWFFCSLRMTTVNSSFLPSFRQCAFSNCSDHHLWFSSTSSTQLSASITCWMTRDTCAVFSNFQDLVDQKWLLLGGTLNELLRLYHTLPRILAKFTRSKFCNQFINKSLLRWVRYGAFHFHIHSFCLFVCVLFVFFLFVIWLVVSPPLPQQGQEYAALGALVNDDEPLSSPPGSTEMELKVKQVCPDIVTCWELVENTSCDLVRGPFLEAPGSYRAR